MKANIQPKINNAESFSERVDEITAKTSYETVKSCISKLKKVLYANPNFAAICAPQIGEDLRLFIVRTAQSESDRFKVFLNPIVVNSEGLHMSREASLTMPNKEFIIPRKNKVHVAYQSANGQVCSETYTGAFGEVIQQMIEMLDGITLADYGLDLDDVGGPAAFDKASKKDKAQLISLYLDGLKDFSSDLADEIKNTPELNYMEKAIEFNTKLASGQIAIEVEQENKEEVPDAV